MKSFKFLPHSIAMMLILSLLLLSACSQEEPAATEENAEVLNADFRTMAKALRATDDQDEQLKVVGDFLTKYPDTERTATALGYGARVIFKQGSEEADYDGAIEFVKSHLPEVKNADYQASAKAILISLYGDAGKNEEFNSLLADLGDPAEIPLETLQMVYPVLKNGKNWDEAEAYTKAVITKIDAELAEADPADDRKIRGLNWSKSAAMETLAVSLSQKGEVDQALDIFKEAKSLKEFNFAGIAYGEFRDSWATALLKKEDYARAMEVLTPDAVFLNKDSSVELYKEAFVANGNNENDLVAHLGKQRKALGREVPEFSVYDYEGNLVNYSDLKGKVTMLAFWFPT